MQRCDKIVLFRDHIHQDKNLHIIFVFCFDTKKPNVVIMFKKNKKKLNNTIIKLHTNSFHLRF